MARERTVRPPERNGEVLVVPPAACLPDLVRANVERRAAWEFDLLGIPAGEIAARARAEFIEPARAFTRALGVEPPDAPAGLVVATGHQPVLPHPGIWLKNHLAARVAQAVGGAGLHFIVDNDTVNLGAIRVPVVSGDGLSVEDVPFVRCPTGVAAEEIEVDGKAAAAPARAVRRAKTALAESLGDEFVAEIKPAKRLVEFVTRPRRRIEETFGVRNLELPVSRLCETESFRTFVAHLIAHARRFAEVYNAALDRHRTEHGITNPVEPVPNLKLHRDTVELPFWTWRRGERRRPMVVPGDARADLLREMLESGLKIRPRALAMTAFFRLFCCDLFVHGTGGAGYEPVNDAVIAEFFGVEPPAWAVASATLFVRLRTPVPSASDVSELRQRLHRMRTTPEVFVDELLPDDAEALELARRRIALRDLSNLPKRERKRVFLESKKLASALRERLARPILAAEKELARLERLDAARAAAEDRRYPFFLHSRAALDALHRFPGLGPAPDDTAQDR